MVCVIGFIANRTSLPFGWSEQLNLNTDGLYSLSFFAYLSHIIVTPAKRDEKPLSAALYISALMC